MCNPFFSSTAVDDSPKNIEGTEHVTPPSSFIGPPTPPATDKRFPQAERILAHFRDIQSGHRKLCGDQSWIQFWLGEGEFDELVRRLWGDPGLERFVKDKVRLVNLDPD
jgi:hypothetical protein